MENKLDLAKIPERFRKLAETRLDELDSDIESYEELPIDGRREIGFNKRYRITVT